MAILARFLKAVVIEVFALKTAWVPMLWDPQALGTPELCEPELCQCHGGQTETPPDPGFALLS